MSKLFWTEHRHSCSIRNLFVRRRSTYWKRLRILHFLGWKSEKWEAWGWCWLCHKIRYGREFREIFWYQWSRHETTGPIAIRSISLNCINKCTNPPSKWGSYSCILWSSSWGYHQNSSRWKINCHWWLSGLVKSKATVCSYWSFALNLNLSSVTYFSITKTSSKIPGFIWYQNKAI